MTTQLNKIPDVLIVGAGIIGLSIARLLQSRGANVLVLEAEEPGAGASGAAAGMLTPTFEAVHWPQKSRQALSKLAGHSMKLWPVLSQELHEETGLGTDLDLSGAMGLASDPVYAKELEALEAEETAAWEAFPADPFNTLKGNDGAPRFGLAIKGEGQISPKKSCAALTASFVKKGGTLLSQKKVRALEHSRSAVSAVILENGERILAGQVLLATGAGTRSLWQEPTPCPIFPVKGQAVMLAMPEAFKISDWTYKKVLRGAGCYICFKGQRDILVGATEEPHVETLDTSEDKLRHLLFLAEMIVPGIGQLACTRKWAGLRPATPDHAPLLDRSAVYENLFYAAGHYRNGVLLAPASAHRLADIVEGKRSDNTAFALDRLTIPAA